VPQRGYQILDYAFSVNSDRSRLFELLDRYLEPVRVDPAGPPTVSYRPVAEGRWWAVEVEGDAEWDPEQAAALSEPGVFDYIFWHAHQQAMFGKEDVLTIHAGVVSWEGKAIVLPAPMDSGKTTTTAGLVRAGFGYLTDEAAMIDPSTGLVSPFPKSLTFEPPTLELFPDLHAGFPPELAAGTRLRYYVRPDELRPGSAAEGGPVGWVIAPRYQRGATTALEPMTRAETVMMLAQNSFNFDAFGGSALEVLGRLTEGAPGYTLRIGDLDGAVAAVRGLVNGS
jgi:hypothetical protein